MASTKLKALTKPIHAFEYIEIFSFCMTSFSMKHVSNPVVEISYLLAGNLDQYNQSK